MRPGDFITPQLRLVRLVGQGGMGSVWLADHVPLCTQVVLKFCQGSDNARREAAGRFQREAALAAQARGPHVVQVHDFGKTADGVPFIAMEYLVGEDLGKRLQRDKRISPLVFAEWLDQITKGLGKAHRLGIVHRDIKPENLFLCSEPEGTLVKVLDFGVAKGSGSEPELSDTKTGALLGTAFYMSPEQINAAKRVDARSDLWSLGVVTYLALTGMRPFEATALGPLVASIRSGKFAPPRNLQPELPKALDDWMRKALAVSPALRFQDAAQMANAFRSTIADFSAQPILATSALRVFHRVPGGKLGAGGAVLVALGAGVLLLRNSEPVRTGVAANGSTTAAASAVARDLGDATMAHSSAYAEVRYPVEHATTPAATGEIQNFLQRQNAALFVRKPVQQSFTSPTLSPTGSRTLAPSPTTRASQLPAGARSPAGHGFPDK